MKKLLLLSCCLFLYTLSQAQVIFYTLAPASVKGNYSFTWAQPASGWGNKDLNIPANAIQDTLMMVHDGSSGDSLGCNPLVNDLTGKIALVYRGSCQFGLKVKNAQDAGAVGVVIINNVAGLINMSGGTNGPSDTIPAANIGQGDGAKLRAQVDAGNPTVIFLGSKKGLYPNDLGLYSADAIVSRATANPKLISANATEWNTTLGAWVHNYGNQSQTNVTLSAYITGAATYSATSAPVATMNVGDSAFIYVGKYSAASYSGLYKVNYVVNDGNPDDFPADNIFYSDFLVDSLFSYALIDSSSNLPYSSSYGREDSAIYKTCIHFRDPNASRLSAKGIYFSAEPVPGEDLGILQPTVYAELYEWNDNFTGLSDTLFFNATTPPWNLKIVDSNNGIGGYTFTTNLRDVMIYLPFDSAKSLKDNQRYLFCATRISTNTFPTDTINLGFDSYLDYTNVQDSTDQPSGVIIAGSAQFAGGYGPNFTPSVTAKFVAKALGVAEINNSFDVTPYPNPTTEFVQIPLKGMNGTAKLSIMDLSGKVVNVQTVKVTDTVSVNVTDVPNGNYIFRMLFENGRSTTFKVVITK